MILPNNATAIIIEATMQAALRMSRAFSARMAASQLTVRTMNLYRPAVGGLGSQVRYGLSMGREEEMKAKGQ